MLTRRSFMGIVAASIVAPLATLLRADKPVRVESWNRRVRVDPNAQTEWINYTETHDPGMDSEFRCSEMYALDIHGNPIRIINGIAQRPVREGQMRYWKNWYEPGWSTDLVAKLDAAFDKMKFEPPRFT